MKQYFFFICEADPVKNEEGKEYIDYTNPVTHEMANPAYGESVQPEELMEQFRRSRKR